MRDDGRRELGGQTRFHGRLRLEYRVSRGTLHPLYSQNGTARHMSPRKNQSSTLMIDDIDARPESLGVIPAQSHELVRPPTGQRRRHRPPHRNRSHHKIETYIQDQQYRAIRRSWPLSKPPASGTAPRKSPSSFCGPSRRIHWSMTLAPYLMIGETTISANAKSSADSAGTVIRSEPCAPSRY